MKRLIITMLAMLAILLFTVPAYAIQSFNYPRFAAFDSNGDPITGGQLFFYANGTTTKKDTYSNYALTVANDNPIELDSDGVADVDIYLDGIYTVTFAPATDSDPPTSPYWTINNVEGYGIGFKWNRTAITNTDTPYTMLSTDDLIEVDTSGGAVEIDVVAAATLGEGRWFVVKVTDATSIVTIDPNGAETIEGAASFVINTAIGVIIYSDGSNLIIVSENDILANNTWLTALDNAGTGTENMIKANASGEVETGAKASTIFTEQASAPTTLANQLGVYIKVKDGQSEFYVVEESDGDEVQVTDQGRVPLPIGWISGLQMSNDTDTDHDIAIATGAARDSTAAVNLALSAVLTKQIDAVFAAGDDAGGMFTGSVGNDTWYHVFLIRKDADGTIDGGFDTDVDCANIPAGYTEYRHIGSVLSNGSANILQFYQSGDIVLWDAAALDLSVSQGTTADLRTLAGVPTDIEVMAILNVYVERNAAGGCDMLISSPNKADAAPSESAAPLATMTDEYAGNTEGMASQIRILTNTSAQIRCRSIAAATSLLVSTQGYIWDRGKN